MIRHRTPDGRQVDALGMVEVAGSDSITVATRRGPVEVPRAAVVAAKRVPPPPARRGRPHKAIGIEDLQELMCAGWPSLEVESLGGWLLRSAGGFTQRANSVLPLGDPGRPLAVALDEVVLWYAARDASPLLQLFVPSGTQPVETELGIAAAEHGWTFRERTLVMTAATAELALVLSAKQQAAERISRSADDDWWTVASDRTLANRRQAQAILDRVPDGLYLTGFDARESADGYAAAHPIAHLRAAFTPGWMGIFDVHVRPEHRREGLGRALMGSAGREGSARGARSTYLQVSGENHAAVALYESLGFTVHHEYWYAGPELARI